MPVLDVSGGSRIVAGHAKTLSARGHDVLVVAPRTRPSGFKAWSMMLLGREPVESPQGRAHVELANVPVHIPPHFGPIQEDDVPDADVIIATWWETAEWIWGMPQSKGAKVHFIQHYEAFSNIPNDRVDAVWRLPTAKIAIAQWLVDLGREKFGLGNIALVPNSVDHHVFASTPRFKGGPPTVGFLFHNAQFKDLPTTLAALQGLRQGNPQVQLLSFGPVVPRRGELQAGTEFYHLPSQEQIAEIYRRCDVWLSTSRTEGFNLPPLEAMASGCPAVCAKTGRPLEIIEDGVNGYLVNQGDVRGFIEKLANILRLPDSKWQRMSQAAVQSVAHPTWDESSALFEDALKRSTQA